MQNAPFFQTGTQIKHVVLFLHGYGANGDDLLSIGRDWQDSLPDTLFIAPNAPYQHPYIDSGYMWFDFQDKQNISPNDVKTGLNNIRPIIKDYVQKLTQEYNVPYSSLVPVGFSQGAMIALDLLTCEPEIKAIIEYAGVYYPMCTSIENAASKKALLVHGTDDTVVPYHHMRDTEKALTELGIHVTSIPCAGLDHGINDEGIRAGKLFLKERL